MNHIIIITGTIFLLTGIVFRRYINRRKFDRSSSADSEQLGYEKNIDPNVVEIIYKLVSWILILTGAFLIMIHWTLKYKKIEKKKVPRTFLGYIKNNSN